jgi:Asp/Glu/hydantoin racemase
MKICLINGSQANIGGVHDTWLSIILANLKKVLRSDTHVEMKTLKTGLKGDNVFDFSNEYFVALNKREILETILEAAKDGFDAAVVALGDDTGVREARSAVGIPVIGPGESAMHLACQMGRRFGAIIANMPGTPLIAQIEDNIKRYGLEGRVIPNGVRFDVHDFADTWEKGLVDPKFAADGVKEGAQKLVDDGADVIVVLCCGIGPFCTAAGLSKVRIGDRDIPVLDAMTISVKIAEMAVDLKIGLDLPFTSMALPSGEDMARVRAEFGLHG